MSQISPTELHASRMMNNKPMPQQIMSHDAWAKPTHDYGRQQRHNSYQRSIDERAMSYNCKFSLFLYLLNTCALCILAWDDATGSSTPTSMPPSLVAMQQQQQSRARKQRHILRVINAQNSIFSAHHHDESEHWSTIPNIGANVEHLLFENEDRQLNDSHMGVQHLYD